jgi:hypothetical protein
VDGLVAVSDGVGGGDDSLSLGQVSDNHLESVASCEVLDLGSQYVSAGRIPGDRDDSCTCAGQFKRNDAAHPAGRSGDDRNTARKVLFAGHRRILGYL